METTPRQQTPKGFHSTGRWVSAAELDALHATLADAHELVKGVRQLIPETDELRKVELLLLRTLTLIEG